MKFFNFNKKTIWIFVILVLILILSGFIKLYTTKMGACAGCPQLAPSAMNIISSAIFGILWPMSYFMNMSETLSIIFAFLIEAIYIYILSCVINQIICFFNKNSKKDARKPSKK